MNQPTSTNTIRALCFKCNDRVPFLTILDDDITLLIECFCGNKQKILIHDYIKGSAFIGVINDIGFEYEIQRDIKKNYLIVRLLSHFALYRNH